MTYLKKVLAEHEWTDEMWAMNEAFEIIHGLFMKLPKHEESALKEQSGKQDAHFDNKADLVDALTQLIHDYRSNK